MHGDADVPDRGPAWAAAGEPGIQGTPDRSLRGRPSHGARCAWLLLVWARSGACDSHSVGRGGGLLHRLRDGADPGAARRSLRVILADDTRLSQQRRSVHGFQGKPRGERQPSRRVCIDGRLRAQRRGGNIGRRGGPGLGGTGAASLHATALSGRSHPRNADEPARHARRRPALRPADLYVRVLLSIADRHGLLCGARVGRAPRASRAASAAGRGRGSGGTLDFAAGVLERLYRNDGRGGGEQRGQRVP